MLVTENQAHSLQPAADPLVQRILGINRSPRLPFCRPKLLQIISPCVLSAPPPAHFYC
jgi:hypothetical protein